jgi:hypothetical protein
MFAVIGTAFAVVPLLFDRILTDSSTGGGCSGTGDIPPEYLPPGLEDGCVSDFSSWLHDGVGPVKLVGLIGIPFALLGVYIVIRTLRTAAWLDGTTLRQRGAFRTRAVDLSTATVSAGLRTTRRSDGDGQMIVSQVPMLVARGETGTISLSLQGAGLDQLPSPELRLLADAMVAGRSTAGPDAEAWAVAAQLRAMADNPMRLDSR